MSQTYSTYCLTNLWLEKIYCHLSKSKSKIDENTTNVPLVSGVAAFYNYSTEIGNVAYFTLIKIYIANFTLIKIDAYRIHIK